MLRSAMLTPIGIDVGRQSIKAVQCAGSRSSPRIVASVVLSRTGEGPVPTVDESRRLGEVLWRHGFQGRRACVGVPEACLLSSVVEVPPARGGAPVRQIAANELARLHGVEPDILESDCWILSPVGGKAPRHEAVAVGVRTVEAVALLEALQSRQGAGLEVLSLDVGPCARARAAMLDTPDEPSWGILDLGWGGARLCVVQRGEIVYDRTLPDAGVAHLDLRLEKECSLTPEDIACVLGRPGASAGRRVSHAWMGVVASFAHALVTEVKESLRYLALHRAMAPTHVVRLTGGGAECGPLVEKLSEELSSAGPLSLSRFVAGGASGGSARSGLAGALGLCLRAA